ncbi:MAG: Crp/Fnr family transcriptional regulator [Taibaiella sp.]|nr:Crp/Fnr family transcriptional regulator [Taibaiella sp.]
MENLLIKSMREHIVLTDDQATWIIERCKNMRYKKGHYIIREGDISRNGIFITEGSVRSYFTDINGQEHVIQLGIEGWWVGDLESFVYQKPGKFYVEAIENSEVTLLPYDVLQIMYKEIPAIERYYRIMFQNAFISFHKRVLENLSMDAESRYRVFKEKYPEMDMRIPQKHVASYLGMSAEFLSKIKKRVMLADRRNNNT